MHMRRLVDTKQLVTGVLAGVVLAALLWLWPSARTLISDVVEGGLDLLVGWLTVRLPLWLVLVVPCLGFVGVRAVRNWLKRRSQVPEGAPLASESLYIIHETVRWEDNGLLRSYTVGPLCPVDRVPLLYVGRYGPGQVGKPHPEAVSDHAQASSAHSGNLLCVVCNSEFFLESPTVGQSRQKASLKLLALRRKVGQEGEPYIPRRLI